ncbi:hydrogenase maturation nickel metallochaperone HypA [Acetivibrio cellulolyticus]|uniref:hydrogenase maturation nickel metallochaperone HypA n=1 Tax=Acetivibrio cellulolyticus TaxID=35830 RepID=UPI0001E2FBBC|nr:hydrogenase maturation nickel metallochaperone HypA [Acetivibrio cellulolyticus]
MHEYSITQQIVKIAEENAKSHGGVRIERIALVVGELSGFIGESIQMYFDILAKGTLAEGAQLDITYIKPQLKCTKCNTYFYRKRFSFECPECGGMGAPTDIGKAFYVKDIDICTE